MDKNPQPTDLIDTVGTGDALDNGSATRAATGSDPTHSDRPTSSDNSSRQSPPQFYA